MRRRLTTLLVVTTLLLIISTNYAIATNSHSITIAAAANLQFALPQLAERFSNDTDIKLKIVYGSSGNFSRQIRQRAPFDVFMSADESYVEDLYSDGLTADQGQVYAKGRIALAINKSESKNTIDLTSDPLSKLELMLTEGKIKRFAIANPAHAPYGLRAQQALEHAQLWQALQQLLVYGENVAQAAQFALSSNAQGGIIAYSQARAPLLADKGNFYLIPADSHEPLLQRMVILNNANDSAKQFFQYMQSDPARQILENYGFDLPNASR